jgi:UDP-4-amino-4,6-dideoxy-N-acetyl-beta-L-altrosamine transaminase|tara:strand:- start:649 stop:1824 length:1176 start_codon:yes stop_codon:yes gene_type:complete
VIPYGRQDIDDKDIEAVISALKSDWLTQGPCVPKFESAVANYCGVNHAVAVNSATSALHLACLALDVGQDDIVWTSPNSFVASANCAVYCGASVDFVDISLENGNMCVEALEEKLVSARANNTLPKVVIPVHFAGQSCDMRTIHTLAKEYGFKVIEDASHAIGGAFENMPVGRCEYADICVFSFHPVKIITTMEGGMALTPNEKLARKMMQLRSHGITSDSSQMLNTPDGPWYYEQTDLGFNYRMNDVEAALGTSQLSKLDHFVSARNSLALMYNKQLATNSLISPLAISPDVYSSYHLYVVRIDGINQPQHKYMVESLRSEGIFAHVHYIPIHLQPYYRSRLPQDYCLPNAQRYYQEAITLPLYPKLTPSEIEFVTDNLTTLVDKIASEL